MNGTKCSVSSVRQKAAALGFFSPNLRFPFPFPVPLPLIGSSQAQNRTPATTALGEKGELRKPFFFQVNLSKNKFPGKNIFCFRKKKKKKNVRKSVNEQTFGERQYGNNFCWIVFTEWGRLGKVLLKKTFFLGYGVHGNVAKKTSLKFFFQKEVKVRKECLRVAAGESKSISRSSEQRPVSEWSLEKSQRRGTGWGRTFLKGEQE